MDIEIQFWKDERVLEMDGGDGSTTICVHLYLILHIKNG